VGRVAGSPEYMAPEVIRAKIEPGRAHLVDLYALGIVAFQLLVGQVPFAGSSAAEVLPQHLNSEPPDLERLRADTPPELAALVAALLAKSPDERPEDCEVVLWELRALRGKVSLQGRGAR